MKVILIQKIEKLGNRGDVKNVSSGYARNFLMPNKMAVLATVKNLKDLESQKELEAKQAEEELHLYQEIASQMDGLELEILAKTGDDGKLFGSINAQKISEALKTKGFDINKDQIKLENQIKEIGEYDVSLELPHGLEAKIKVIIVEETEQK